MHKRIFAWVMALVLFAALTACGKRETPAPTEPQATEAQTTAAREAEGDIASPYAADDYRDSDPTQSLSQPVKADETQPTAAPDETKPADGQTGVLFQKYVQDKVADGRYTLRTEQSGMKIVIVMDGENSAIDSDAAGLLHFGLVHKGGNYYMIMHTTKRYTQMTEEEYKKQVDTLGSSSVDLSGMRFRESGSEVVNGKRYSTETYDEREQGVVTYFFDETGIRRTRMVRNGKTTETDVFVVSDDVDASAFEVPADYTLVADPAQLLT